MAIHHAKIADVSLLQQVLSEAPAIAIDTEFHAERRFTPRLFLIQVQVPGQDTWIIDPLIPGLLAALGPVLRSVPWIVHGGAQDMRVLYRVLGDLPEIIWDTQIAAGLISTCFPCGYAQLNQTWLGKHIDKGQTLSDWSQRPLTAQQLHYAAEDVRGLPQLWSVLRAKVAERGRLPALKAACREARGLALSGPDGRQAWRELPAARILDGEARLVLQGLAAWRLERALLLDRPVRSIVSDGVLIDLARRQPSTTAAMLSNRRTPRSIAKIADELLLVVAQAKSRPPAEQPAGINKYTREEALLGLLVAWSQAFALSEQIAAPLLLPVRLLEDLAVQPSWNESVVAGCLGEWRSRLCLRPVLQLLLGRSGVGVVGAAPALLPHDQPAEDL